VAVERAEQRILPWVFRRSGKPIKDMWRVGCRDQSGLAGRIPHDFRRTAVRNLERAEVRIDGEAFQNTSGYGGPNGIRTRV
jgi:hypothetical protein